MYPSTLIYSKSGHLQESPGIHLTKTLILPSLEHAILTIFLCKSAGFQKCDFSVIIKVFFVADKDDHNVRTGKSPCICQPVCERVVCFTALMRRKKQWQINSNQNKDPKVDTLTYDLI